MRAVLGVDAAWTAHNPSGVALVEEGARGWRLRGAAPSYLAFQALARGGIDASGAPLGSKPDAAALLDACRALTGAVPSMIAVDMPLSREPITGRRESDRAISSAYGAKGCATHSPSAERPGKISDDLRADLERQGFHLWTRTEAPRPLPGLIEVYPHPALVELTGARRRLEYKAGKTKAYWPGLSVGERKLRLLDVWRGRRAASDPG